MTSAILSKVKERYAQALRDYLTGKGEEALRQAYEIGREAVAEGVTLLDMAAIHREAWLRFLGAAGPSEKDGAAFDFLAETLSPFEMIQRGYRDAVASLRRRADELDATNLKLQGEVSERRKAEQNLKELNESLEQKVRERTAEAEERSKDLDRSNSELRQFAYVVSHDLQEPLRMVKSFLQMLQDRYGQKLDAQADEFIGYAVDGASRMHRLIIDLLEYSRVGTTEKAFEKADLSAALKDALSNLKLAVEENGAVVTSDPLPTLWADPVQMALLFQNLVGNALKFKRELPPRIHVSAARRGKEWVLGVRDNGLGIEKNYFERIFVIFQRLHSRSEYPGTGIGLAVCKKIVERHGGTIWVESEPGKGSTFYFTVPVREEA